MASRQVRKLLMFVLLCVQGAAVGADRPDPLSAFDLAVFETRDLTVRYEKSLEGELAAIKDAVSACQDVEAEQAKKLRAIEEKADELIDRVNQIIALSPTREQRESQKRILGDFPKTCSVTLIGPKGIRTICLLTRDSIKAHMRKGGALPGFSYDAKKDEVTYQLLMDPRGGVADVREPIIPVGQQSAAEDLRQLFAGIGQGFGAGIAAGVALHELTEISMMGLRFKPWRGDPYWRWFADGFSNAIAINVLKERVGAAEAAAFAAGCDTKPFLGMKEQVDLRHWMAMGLGIEVPIETEERLRQARYAFATQEALRLTDKYGVGVVGKILDKACKDAGNKSEGLVTAIQAVTGEDMAKRLDGYQSFRTEAEGIEAHAGAFNAAMGRKDYATALPHMLRIHELRCWQEGRPAPQFYSNSALVLFWMGMERAGDKVILDHADYCKSDLEGAYVAMHAIFIDYALKCGNLKKAVASSDIVLAAKPDDVPALAVRMLKTADVDLAGAKKMAEKIVRLAKNPGNPWVMAAQKVLDASDTSAAPPRAPRDGQSATAPSEPGSPKPREPREPASQAASQPAKDALAKRIAGLIGQLGAESYKDRQAAQQELIKIGLPAVEALKAAAEGNDAERVSLAGWALKQIRKALLDGTAEWGQPNDGMRCRWVFSGRPVPVGTQPELTVEVQNVSNGLIEWQSVTPLVVTLGGNIRQGGMHLAFQVESDRGVYATDSGLAIPAGGTVRLKTRWPHKVYMPGRYHTEAELFRQPIGGGSFTALMPITFMCPPMVVSVADASGRVPDTDPMEGSAGLWGPVVDGMQVRINGGLSFHNPGAWAARLSVDIRNFGKLPMSLLLMSEPLSASRGMPAKEAIEVEVDGVWYRGDKTVGGTKTTPLGPGNRYRDMEVMPANDWLDNSGQRLNLGTVKRTFRVAVTVQPADGKGKPVRLVSNAVVLGSKPESPILRPPTTAPTSAPATSSPTAPASGRRSEPATDASAAPAPDAATARRHAAQRDIAGIVAALNIFEIETGRYPDTAEGLAALLEKPAGATEWNGPYIRSKANDGRINDPWGRPYAYRCPGGANPNGFELLSLGADGKEGTADDVREQTIKTPAPAGGPVSASQPEPGQPRGPATQPAGAALAKRVVQLVQQLGAERYKDRQAAQQELVKIGLPAVEAINAAASDKDPERAQRARQALEELLPNTATIWVATKSPRTNMPIWVDVNTDNDLLNANLRYPFATTPWFFKQYAFEVRKDGRPLPPRALNRGAPQFGGFGSVAPLTSPKGRLPLHLAYSFSEPGKYEVRLLIYRDGPLPPNKTGIKALLAVSDWIKLDVQATPEAERKQWQAKMIAHPPEDVGLLVGDYLPSLLARPDDAAAGALEDSLHHKSTLVQNYALYSLWAYYDDKRLGGDIPAIIKKRGPTSLLAYYLSWRKDLFADAAPGLVDSCIGYLDSKSPDTVDGAVKALMWLKHQYDWAKRPEVPARIDKAILDNADAIIKGPEVRPSETGGVLYPAGTMPPGVAQRIALAVYLGGVKTEASRKLLWKIAEDKAAREQATIALCWIADPADLPELAKILLEKESPAAASLPYHLYRAYGKASLPYIEKAFREAPDERVRDECGKWLKAANDPRTGILQIPDGRRLTLDGATITDDYLLRLKGAEVESLMLHQTSVTDAGLANLTQIASLGTLYLRTQGIKGDGLAHLKDIHGLVSLELPGIALDEKALATVAELDGLRALSIPRMAFTGEGLAVLRTMKDLRKLHLYGCGIDDANIAPLTEIKTLESLDLTYCTITDAGLAKLKTMTGLKELRIGSYSTGNGHVTDAGLAHLTAMKNLQTLDLTGQSAVTGKGIQALAGLKDLRTLELGGTNVRAGDLRQLPQITDLKIYSNQVQPEALQAMKNLKMLCVYSYGNLGNLQAFQDEMKKLEKLMPNCKVIWIAF